MLLRGYRLLTCNPFDFLNRAIQANRGWIAPLKICDLNLTLSAV